MSTDSSGSRHSVPPNAVHIGVLSVDLLLSSVLVYHFWSTLLDLIATVHWSLFWSLLPLPYTSTRSLLSIPIVPSCQHSLVYWLITGSLISLAVVWSFLLHLSHLFYSDQIHLNALSSFLSHLSILLMILKTNQSDITSKLFSILFLFNIYINIFNCFFF